MLSASCEILLFRLCDRRSSRRGEYQKAKTGSSGNIDRLIHPCSPCSDAMCMKYPKARLLEQSSQMAFSFEALYRHALDLRGGRV